MTDSRARFHVVAVMVHGPKAPAIGLGEKYRVLADC